MSKQHFDQTSFVRMKDAYDFLSVSTSDASKFSWLKPLILVNQILSHYKLIMFASLFLLLIEAQPQFVTVFENFQTPVLMGLDIKTTVYRTAVKTVSVRSRRWSVDAATSTN